MVTYTNHHIKLQYNNIQYLLAVVPTLANKAFLGLEI